MKREGRWCRSLAPRCEWPWWARGQPMWFSWGSRAKVADAGEAPRHCSLATANGCCTLAQPWARRRVCLRSVVLGQAACVFALGGTRRWAGTLEGAHDVNRATASWRRAGGELAAGSAIWTDSCPHKSGPWQIKTRRVATRYGCRVRWSARLGLRWAPRLVAHGCSRAQRIASLPSNGGCLSMIQRRRRPRPPALSSTSNIACGGP